MLGDVFGNFEEQQEVLKQKLAEINLTEELEDGKLVVEANANREVLNVNISQELLQDKEQLEDLLVVAMNNILEKASFAEMEETQKFLKDIIPPGMGGLFS